MIRVLAPSNPFWANSERAASSIAALVSIARCCSRRFVVRFRVPVCARRVRKVGGLALGFGSFMIGASTGRYGQYGRFKLLRGQRRALRLISHCSLRCTAAGALRVLARYPPAPAHDNE